MRMMWWFIILGLSGTIAVIAGLAMYARVRRHMKASGAAAHEESGSGPEI
jgi:hypothetical protein